MRPQSTETCGFVAPIATQIRPAELSRLNKKDLNKFLAECEGRAFRTALFAVKHQEDALDIVQDAMMKFVAGYGNNDKAEWPLLFHRILQNSIKDFFRRQKVRNRWTVMLDHLRPPIYNDDPGQIDPFETIADQRNLDGATHLTNERTLSEVEKALSVLPLRQQQAFLLRSWEGLSTRDTAAAMGCSEGSVKTHYSRAMTQLKQVLVDN